MKALPLPLLAPLAALGEDLKPFDRLGRNNVTIRAQHKSEGSSTDYYYKASWGSYDRTVKSVNFLLGLVVVDFVESIYEPTLCHPRPPVLSANRRMRHQRTAAEPRDPNAT